MRNWIVIALVLGVVIDRSLAEETFPIKLTSPAKIGERTHVSVSIARKFSQTWTNAKIARVPVSENFEALLDGVETVNAVNANGRITAETIDVITCHKDGAQLLPPGTKVSAQTVDGMTKFTIDGQPPSDDLKHALRELIYTARSDEPTADDEFGTAQPKKVGESWPLHADQVVKGTHLSFRITPEDFKGCVRLDEVSVKDGLQSETVSADESCEFDGRPGEGGVIKNMKMDRKFTFVVPLATASHSQSLQTFSSIYIVSTTDGDRHVHGESKIDRKYSDVPK